MKTAIAAVLAVVLAIAAPAAAACPKTTLGDVEDEVMCPVCGTPLELATESPQAQRERELIRRLVADCRSKDEVKTVLAAELGDKVLAVPGAEGFDLAAYLVPALAILLAGGAVGVAALRWRRGREAGRIRHGCRMLRVPHQGDARVTDVEAERAEAGEPRSQSAAPGAAATRRLEADLERYDL